VGAAAAAALARPSLRVCGSDAPAGVVALLDLGGGGPKAKVGSSHGASRIIRRTYASEHLTALMPTAYSLWDSIDPDLIRRVGGVDFAKPGNECFAAVLRSADACGVPYTTAPPPGHTHALQVPEGWQAIYQPDAGVLRADAARAKLLSIAADEGVEIMHNTPATRFERCDGRWKILIGDGGVIDTKRIIVAAGTHTRRLLLNSGLPAPPLRVRRVTAAFWRQNQSKHDDATDVFRHHPIFIDYETGLYGLFDEDHPLHFKVSDHDGPLLDFAADAGEAAHTFEEHQFASRGACDTKLPPIIRGLFGDDLDASPHGPAHAEPCTYTMSPDEEFVIGHADEERTVVVASCCSGHGAKLAPVSGALAAHAALEPRGQLPETPLSGGWNMRSACAHFDICRPALQDPNFPGAYAVHQPS